MATTPAIDKIAALRASGLMLGGVTVNDVAGVIENAAVMTIGPTLGHGFDIDATSIQQVCDLINANPDGVLCRFKHPEVDSGGYQSDALGTVVGRIKNARIVGDSVRGDVHLGDYAKIVPGLGDVRSYILSLAKDDPAALGLSAVIHYEVDPQTDKDGNPTLLPARIFAVDAVDLVGKPAANPNGLLSAEPRAFRAWVQVGTQSMSFSAPTMEGVIALRDAYTKPRAQEPAAQPRPLRNLNRLVLSAVQQPITVQALLKALPKADPVAVSIALMNLCSRKYAVVIGSQIAITANGKSALLAK